MSSPQDRNGIILNDLCNVPSFIVTFSDIVSHGSGMKSFGVHNEGGFKNEDLLKMHSVLKPGTSELHNIKTILPQTLYDIPDVYVLIMRNYFVNESNNLWNIFNTIESSNQNGEITGVQWDDERIHNNKLVKNKLNKKLLFLDLSDSYKHSISITENRGTIYNYQKIPALKNLHTIFESTMCGPLQIEGTMYYNTNECYTPLHQEKEKWKIINLCVGKSIPINFIWFHQTERVSNPYSILLNHGDLCLISEFAAGVVKEKQTRLYLKSSIGYNNKAYEF